MRQWWALCKCFLATPTFIRSAADETRHQSYRVVPHLPQPPAEEVTHSRKAAGPGGIHRAFAVRGEYIWRGSDKHGIHFEKVSAVTKNRVYLVHPAFGPVVKQGGLVQGETWSIVGELLLKWQTFPWPHDMLAANMRIPSTPE